MAGYIRIVKGTGIASFTYAYNTYDASTGLTTRHPESGYSTNIGASMTLGNVVNFYIHEISFSSSYGKWTASYTGGAFSAAGNRPTSGSSYVCHINAYPNSVSALNPCVVTLTGVKTSVSCTRQIYTRSSSNSGAWSDGGSGTVTLNAGASYTPSENQPFSNSDYVLTQIITSDGIDCTSGSITVPSYNFTINYYYTRTYVTATKNVYYRPYTGGSYTYQSSETESGLSIGGKYTPSASSHLPPYSSSYGLTQILYGSTNVTSGQMTCPSSDFTLNYYFTKYNTHTLRYDANGGSGAPSAQSVTDFNEETGLTISYTEPTRSGYDFQGWAESSTASSPSYYGGGTIYVKASKRLYAVWKESKKAKVPDASFTVTAKGTNSLTIRVTQTNLEAGTWSFYISTTSDFSSGNVATGTPADYSTSSLTLTFTGLSENTRYYVRAWNAYNQATQYTGSLGSTRTNISAFAWTSDDSTNVAAGRVPRTAITAAKWNTLHQKVSTVSVRQGSGSVSYTGISSGARITAALFNAMRLKIAALTGGTGGPAAQSAGAGMKASLFTALKTAINNAITYTNNNT